ncbi:hypothetical protein HBI23_245140 [Parastagonospora nodorum]|nr:hypothetical protein HBI47_245830 [Parastagonospora nodorum]KAH5619123.1 hypothetical protein HBI23_245140 [Parastagonospora nodorum]
MPPRASKKRARSLNVHTTSTKRLRISATPPPPTTPSQAWERQQLDYAGTGSVATTTETAEDSYIDNGGDNFDGLD